MGFRAIFFLGVGLAIGVTCNAQTLNLNSSNLPIIVIDTHGQQIPDDPKITADMGIIDNGSGNRNRVDDPFNDFYGLIGIEIRGSSSQMFPKKQYGVEVRDSTGNDLNASLLGMPAESDWVLYAPYDDKSLIRDALAYKLANDLGDYAPRTRYCELILNGEYEGIYVLIEKIKRGKDRVDISKLKDTDLTGDDLTGGYILKIDKTDGNSGPGWVSEYPPLSSLIGQQIYFQYEYPDWDKIATEQAQYIRQYISDFEDALAGPDFEDPDEGYQKYIDVDSWIDYFIIEEVTRNVDAYRASTFFYKNKDTHDPRIHMGPVWDFNEGFGNANYCDAWLTTGFAMDFNKTCPTDLLQVPFWWDRLFQDTSFVRKVGDRWAALREGPLKTDRILTYIDSVSSVLTKEAEERNFQRWPILNTYVWPNYYVGSDYTSEVAYLEQWIFQRMGWLDVYLGQRVTGLPATDMDSWIAVSPNPFHGTFYVEGTAEKPGIMDVEVYDLLGRPQGERTQQLLQGKFKIPITMSLATAIYTYTVKLNGKPVKRGKLVCN